MAEAADKTPTEAELAENFAKLLSFGAEDAADAKSGGAGPGMKNANSGEKIQAVPDSDTDSDGDGGDNPFTDGFINGMSYTAAQPTSAQQEARVQAVQAQTYIDLWADAPKPCLKYEPEDWVQMITSRQEYMKKITAYWAKKGKSKIKAKDMKVDEDTGVPTSCKAIEVNAVNGKPTQPVLEGPVNKKKAKKIAKGEYGIQGYIPWKLILKEDLKGLKKRKI